MNRAGFLALLLAASLIALAGINWTFTDWQTCIREDRHIGPALWMLVTPQQPAWTNLFVLLPALPLALLALGPKQPDRAAWVAGFCFIGFLLWLFSHPGAYHSCDRKGDDGFFLLIPALFVSLALTFAAALFRAVTHARRGEN
ncbi:hypothetical protein [Stagnihabitans tardus]|uniref:Transmembrane protein n=1 Tax=Stagnihabitans tardus TaxID=2699202 RepID=A0AAE5BR04_9RHOB|nr:hypothetical protein [Stagnihabitans tardus]NBZ85985.1 hypothetical protein [Stagnihabitans tardus]